MLLLSATGVKVEHLQAANLHLISPNDQNKVLNREMKGMHLCTFTFILTFYGVGLKKNKKLELINEKCSNLCRTVVDLCGVAPVSDQNCVWSNSSWQMKSLSDSLMISVLFR